MKVSREKLNKIIQEELETLISEESIDEEGFLKKAAGAVGGFFKGLKRGANTGSQASLPMPGQSAAADTAPPAAATPPASAEAPPQAEKPADAPAAATQPEQPAATPKDAVADSTADIVLPHAIVIKNLLVKQIAQSLQKTLGGLSQDQRKVAMGPVMQYLNNLPNMASKVVAEAMTPDQIKALKAKHAGNVSLINKNLQGLEGEIMNGIKSQLNTGNTPNMLFQAIEKTHGNSKEGLQYMKSLQKNPQGHLDALLANTQLVLKNVMAILQKNMPSGQGQPKLGGSQQPTAPAAAKPAAKPAAPAPVKESKEVNRWKKLAGLIKG